MRISISSGHGISIVIMINMVVLITISIVRLMVGCTWAVVLALVISTKMLIWENLKTTLMHSLKRPITLPHESSFHFVFHSPYITLIYYICQFLHTSHPLNSLKGFVLGIV